MVPYHQLLLRLNLNLKSKIIVTINKILHTWRLSFQTTFCFTINKNVVTLATDTTGWT